MGSKITSTLNRTEAGNIEILYTVPGSLILKEKEHVLEEFATTMTISGFRKGKAPLNRVEEAVGEEELAEHILSHLLPRAFSDSVQEHKFNPAMYPKFEANKITSSKNVGADTVWEIKAITCELPKVTLPKDYKKKLKHDEKDQNVLIKSLLETVKVEVPKLLIDEEVNGRLSQVLQRIEKLGLTLEGYLKSVGKTPEGLREEYQQQAKEAIALELILNAVANDEKVEVEDKEVIELIKTTGEDEAKINEEQRNMLKRVILRRKALEKLATK